MDTLKSSSSVIDILHEMYDNLKRLKKGSKQQGVTELLQHCLYKDITADIRLYIEEQRLWFQFRVRIDDNKEHKVDFKKFIDKNKVVLLPSGKLSILTDFFINSFEDEHHRFGADYIIDSNAENFSFDDASDLMDYLLTYPYFLVCCNKDGSKATDIKGVSMFILSCCRSSGDIKDVLRTTDLYEKYCISLYFNGEDIVDFIDEVKQMGFLTTNHTKKGQYKNKTVFRGIKYY